MKFHYDEKEDRGECVAFIHINGALIVKLDEPEKDDYCQVVGSGNDSQDWWNIWMKKADKKFYPGDKITIEF